MHSKKQYTAVDAVNSGQIIMFYINVKTIVNRIAHLLWRVLLVLE